MVEDVFDFFEVFFDFNFLILVLIIFVDLEIFECFKECGVDYIGVGFDVVSERFFREIKLDLLWEEVWDFVGRVIDVFGCGKVLFYVIVGFGEIDGEFVNIFICVREIGVDVFIFVFMFIKGICFENRELLSFEYY